MHTSIRISFLFWRLWILLLSSFICLFYQLYLSDLN
nr:MAG TPA: hypothetical protein [Caudoviricetes sp.]